jgi:hypothetical protein
MMFPSASTSFKPVRAFVPPGVWRNRLYSASESSKLSMSRPHVRAPEKLPALARITSRDPWMKTLRSARPPVVSGERLPMNAAMLFPMNRLSSITPPGRSWTPVAAPLAMMLPRTVTLPGSLLFWM